MYLTLLQRSAVLQEASVTEVVEGQRSLRCTISFSRERGTSSSTRTLGLQATPTVMTLNCHTSYDSASRTRGMLWKNFHFFRLLPLRMQEFRIFVSTDSRTILRCGQA
eukprot:TRINITY_DN5591_c0_g1_i1.p2 TRINITY_DN5591_c0_g1~~TRINITY_DN5591_c0_g1_i1.p2  ORF type:complete len:108 (+),score=7.04 TRINITY_DN5591_c0_g1_i1:677-1000(+)